MNHQEIADRICGLHFKYQEARAAADAPIDAEKKQLQAACGEIGHVFRVSPHFSHVVPVCAICDHWVSKPSRVDCAIGMGNGDVVVDGSTAVMAKAGPSEL